MISLILLAGGSGERMKSDLPKQFLPLKNKGVVFYSLDVFRKIRSIHEVIVVTDPKWRDRFANYTVKWALPGLRRQDSLFNGLKELSNETKWVLVHDAARPLITEMMVHELIEEGKKVGAATLAIPMKATVKEATQEKIVSKTLDRTHLWEIQTPQFVSRSLLEEGFRVATSQNLTVTDDTSLAELCNHPVKLVMGSSLNIKITTPEDLQLVSALVS